MKENYQKSLGFVLIHEGGYVNDPADPGGATNKGITQAVYDKYRKDKGQVAFSVKNISDAEVSNIYKQRYWDACGCDELPSGIDYAVFDYAIHSGPSKSLKDLDSVLGVSNSKDRNLFLAQISADQAQMIDIITKFIKKRESFLNQIIAKTPSSAKFKKGWLNRIWGKITGYQKNDTGVLDRAIDMLT